MKSGGKGPILDLLVLKLLSYTDWEEPSINMNFSVKSIIFLLFEVVLEYL